MQFDSYEDAGVNVAVRLVNELAIEHAFGRPARLADPFDAVHGMLSFDAASVAQLIEGDVSGFIALAGELRAIFGAVAGGDVDAAASRLNDLLSAHPAHPHLAKDRGQWRLHHHPADASLVPMYTAICAEGVARMVGAGAVGRLGTCAATDCDRVFLDGSKNASRRFCSTTCQNRVKAAAFRRRQAASDK